MSGADLVVLVLAGGRGRRMGGADKAALVVAGELQLARVLRTLPAQAAVAVVGPRHDAPLPRPVAWCREDPPGGGPLAGVAAGLAATTRPWVALVAVDLARPALLPWTELLAAASRRDGAVCRCGGDRQWLAGVYARTPLATRTAAVGSVSGVALHRVLSGLDLTDVDADPMVALDLDTWDDVRATGTLVEPVRARHRPIRG